MRAEWEVAVGGERWGKGGMVIECQGLTAELFPGTHTTPAKSPEIPDAHEDWIPPDSLCRNQILHLGWYEGQSWGHRQWAPKSLCLQEPQKPSIYGNLEGSRISHLECHGQGDGGSQSHRVLNTGQEP